MISDKDADLVAALLEHGILAPADLADTLGGDVTQSLAERTRLSPEQLDRLQPNSTGRPSRLGKYRLLQMLGKGGMGEVHLALDLSLGRLVALKVLAKERVRDLQRFLREAQIVGRLNHPNIVQLYEAGQEQGDYFLAMQYVEGTSLSERSVSIPEAVRAIRDAARAAHHAHEAGIVHRDIKPNNLLRTMGGHVYLTDFGIAKELTHDDLTLTHTGDVVGTPAFMSPEQAWGEVRSVRPWTDVYGLGATLYFLLTQQSPYVSKDLVNLVGQIRTEDPLPPRRLNPSLSRDLELVVLKAMARKPWRRYGSAQELADDLERVSKGEPVEAETPSVFHLLTNRVRRHRRIFSATLAVALAFLGGILMVRFLSQRSQSAPLEERSPRERARALVEEARKELARGRESLYRPGAQFFVSYPIVDGAIERLREATTLDSGSAEGFLELARAFDLVGDCCAARQACTQALERQSDSVEARALRSRLDLEEALMESEHEEIRSSPAWTRGRDDLRLLGDSTLRDTKLAAVLAAILAGEHAKAHELLDRYQKEYRTDYEDFLKLKADLWGRQENSRFALAAYDQTIQRRPKFFQAMTFKASILFREGRNQEASDLVSEVIRTSPRYRHAYYVRARILRTPNSMGPALEMHPEFAPGYWFQAQLRVTENDLSGAVESYTRSLAHGAGSEALRRRAGVYRMIGDDLHALEDLEKVAKDPAYTSEVAPDLEELRKKLGR